MTSIIIRSLVLQGPEGQASQPLQLESKAGQLHRGSDLSWSKQDQHLLWSYAQKEPGVRKFAGEVAWQPPAFVTSMPVGLENLRVSAFLQAIYYKHHPDEWDQYTPLVVEALSLLDLKPACFARTISQLHPDKRLLLAYVMLALRPWSILFIRADAWVEKAEDLLAHLLEKNQAVALILEGGS